MNRHLLRRTIYCLCFLMLAFAPTARTQDKTDGAQQAEDQSGKPPVKAQEEGKPETAVDVQGTQVATEETPSAASNADELRKEAQNPIASLISVPFQENFNFGIGPADRTQNILNIQPVIPISVSKDWNLVTFSKEEIPRIDLGDRPDSRATYGHQHSLSGTGKTQRGTERGCAGAARPLDDWASGKQLLVRSRPFRCQ
jgi:hypothetical protein